MDFFEHIETYKEGSIDPELRAEFESAMEKDPSLQLAVKNHALVQEIADGLIEIEAAELLESIRKNKKTQHIRILRWGSVAAVGLLLISSILVFNMFTEGNKYEQMAIAHYAGPENNTTRSVSIPSETLAQGIYYYHLNDWEKSNSIFQSILNNSNSTVASFYMANQKFNNGNYDEVEQYTSKIVSGEYSEESQYLEGLAKLAMKDLEKAKSIFTTIVSNGKQKKVEAEEILLKLK